MAFDPNAYLSSIQTAPPTAAQAPSVPAQAFDPNAYLAAASDPDSAAAGFVGTTAPSQMAPNATAEAGSETPNERPLKPINDTLADIALQGGGATAGQALGALGGPFDEVTIPAGGAIGGAVGDYYSQKRKIAEGEQPSLKYGELAGAALAGSIPGGSLEKQGILAVASQAAKQGIGGLAAETANTLIDDKRLPTAREAIISSALPALGGAVAEHLQQATPEIAAAVDASKTQNATKSSILAKAQDEGFVVQPSSVNPSLANKTIESMAGGPSIRQAATHVNQDVADNIARRVLDPANPDVELTSSLAQQVRKQAYNTGYAPIASVGEIKTDPQYISDLNNILATRQGASRSFPGLTDNSVEDSIKPLLVDKFDAGDALKATQVLRDKAGAAYASGNNELGKSTKGASQAIEDQIQRHLTASGAPGQQLLSNFTDARQLMAQSHDIEDAIREGGGSIIPSVIGSKFQAQKPLSGPLATLGGFANNFPNVTREASKTAIPGTTVTGNFARIAQAGALAAGMGAATHNPLAVGAAGAVGAALPSVRGLVRNLVLSKPYQRIMAKIPVVVNENAPLLPLAVRQGTQAATQDDLRQPAP